MPYIKIFYCILLCLGCRCVQAQDKQDYTWLFGYHKSGYDPVGAQFKFTEDSLIISGSNLLGGLFESAVISDSVGNLQFYSDGCMVVNAAHQMMENGDSINAPGSLYSGSCGKDSVGYDSSQGLLALPHPGKSGQYVLFQIYAPDKINYKDRLLYTAIDMNANNGQGKVLAKNQLLYHADFPFAECLTAVRHGNGRDWWIVVPDGNYVEASDTYIRYLLDPSGISGPFIQHVGGAAKRRMSNLNQAVFSPDGTKYARVSGAIKGVLLMHFDRCSGLFSCPKVITAETDKQSLGGAAFSANSRYLYISFVNDIHQIDTDTKSPDYAQSKLIDSYDGYKNFLPTNFYRMMLAPNGKIYMCCGNGSFYLHTIHAPDSAGLACDFRQHDLRLPSTNPIGMNNFPYFRLYDVPDSICDTLGINAPQGVKPAPMAVPEEGVSVYPNPAYDQVRIALSACEAGRLRIYSASGQLMYNMDAWTGPQNIGISVENWPAGMYFVQVYAYKSGPSQIVKKFVVAH